MKKLYEVIIGANQKVIDTPAVPASTNPDGSQVPAVEEVFHVVCNNRVDSKNVIATDAADAIAKITLEDGQFIDSVNRINNIDVE